jgi:bifunctional N-acetylglucosamine-1-phosphate-uridyltransferase/glucosamine-1-phosphate-acetyltransferase GlmU-like protein
MAAPNIVGPSTITAKTAFLTSVTGATGTVLLNNAASSGKAFQVTTLFVSNIDGTNAVDVTIEVHNQDDGAGTGHAICSTVTVPADATLIVVSKDTPVWLEEDRSIVVNPSASNDIQVVCSYLEIS